ncbi:MAG: sugar kinase [Clostridium sp.]|uniref:sugar kinase n=1 Tax=Clostridium sp. TaxID=1506 RepID=UPI0025BA7157|nr:sugar kinase [Clostridium sp.]MBS4956964.1 sugar kinase [Clostridium sp.]
MAKVVTLGEVMLRLSPPGNERFMQATSFDINYGGGEANVAVSLANYGHNVSFVSKIPNNAIGECAIGTLRKFNVNCDHIARGGDRLGIYFLENGASIRPSSVVYDRANSAIAEADVSEFDFDEIFNGVDLFHVSGITPVISKKGAKITLAALKSAKNNNVKVSFDLNYRAKLWTEEISEKQEVLSEMMEYVDICFGNPKDAAKMLAFNDGENDFINGDYSICISEENMKKVIEKYKFEYLITTNRQSISASDNGWSSLVCNSERLYNSKKYNLHIVDRVGGGDSFAAGFLHGVLSDYTMEQSLEFATAAAAIKHTMPGDLNITTVDEVLKLALGDGAGRVDR